MDKIIVYFFFKALYVFLNYKQYLCFDNERNFKSSYINTASLWCIVLKNQRRLCKQLTSVLQACINIS